MEERLSRLESKIDGRKWWRNPGWWGVILSTVVGLSGLVWQIKPWEAFEDDKPGTVKLIEAHAAAFAKNQWDADLRVVNGTSRAIVVERVTATFGVRNQGQGCQHNGVSTRVLYPVSQLRARAGLNRFERIRPGEGAPFKGGPNIDGVFGAERLCPLPVAKLKSPHDKVTFTVFTDNGSELKTTKRLFFEPRARVRGGGGLPCFLLIPFC
ncbi:MAG TPA: hypothetical protein VFW48_05695 [Solirubrobacterales bacterium]|nr:hypothetical protein [Solirubrobacterales bacterium]